MRGMRGRGLHRPTIPTEDVEGVLDDRRAEAAEAAESGPGAEVEPAEKREERPLAENVSDTGRRDYAPHGYPADTGVLATLKRTVKEFNENHLTDQAAALTYYGLLAVFPALIALV